MEHLIEIFGCIDIPKDVKKDTVIDGFIEWVESNGCILAVDFVKSLMNIT